jgi:flagellar biosynthesis protein FlhB
MSGEKTEKPTAQRKKEARREGRVPRTPDLGSWGGLLAATTVLPMLVRNTMTTSQHLLLQAIGIISDPDPDKALMLFSKSMREAALAVAPLAVGILAVGVAAAASQGGIHVATKLFKPDFKRLNPLQGLKRSFGPHALWEVVKATMKTAVLGAVVYYSLRGLVPKLMTASSLSVSATFDTITGAVLGVLRTAAAAGFAMAFADYAMARRRIGKQIRMSKQDIKDEYKRSEGDPHLKQAIRGKQMQMARQRMMSDLAKADVVLVNPTHVAVALRYDPSRGAPRVVAKGAGAVAAKIREVAAEKRIPMVQDVPLARALHKACDLGDEIPPELYAAVARVLAFVMSLKARGSAAGTHRTPVAAAA